MTNEEATYEHGAERSSRTSERCAISVVRSASDGGVSSGYHPVIAIQERAVSTNIENGCERSRQILCGVHETLQKARLNQGAAGILPAAKIASEAAFRAYYASCSERDLKVVQKFVE